MIFDLQPWHGLVALALWIASAVFHTSRGFDDKKPLPIPFPAQVVGRLLIFAPLFLGLPVLILGILAGINLGSIVTIIVVLALWTPAIKKIPVVGGWVSAVIQRDTERLRKGLL